MIKKDEINRWREKGEIIRQHLKEMRIVSKSSMGNTAFYIYVNNTPDFPGTILPKPEKQIDMAPRDYTGGKFWRLKGNYGVKGYYWNHCGPSEDDFFFNALLAENDNPERIRFFLKKQYKNQDFLFRAFNDVFNSDFDFPVGGADIFVLEILSLKILSDDNYLENIKKLVNFICSELFGYDGIG